MIEKLKSFFEKFLEEFKKVEWPSKKEIISLTVLVILLCFFSAVYIGAFDFVFSGFLGRIGLA